MDRRAIAAGEIDPVVHPLVAQDGMAPHGVTRRDASARRTHHAAALLAEARRLEPLRAAALGPFEHRQLRLCAADQPGIEQLARLDLPRSEEQTSELQSLMRTSYAVY